MVENAVQQTAAGEVAPGERGSWLRSLGVDPGELAGRIVTTAAWKGGVGKTFLALELAHMLDAVLVDFDWDKGNASRAWGFREETRATAPLLDALERGRTPRPLAGGPWRADLIPCHADFVDNQPSPEQLTRALESWAADLKRPLVVDTHPGGVPATYGAVAAAHVVVVPVVLAEREMEATEGMIGELKSYPLLLVPNKVGVSPQERYISWLERITSSAKVPVGPVVGRYEWLSTRRRRMAVTATQPVPARAQRLVGELQRVGEAVVSHVRVAV